MKIDNKIENKKIVNKINKVEEPNIEILELVCQNTPDWTHGTVSID